MNIFILSKTGFVKELIPQLFNNLNIIEFKNDKDLLNQLNLDQNNIIILNREVLSYPIEKAIPIIEISENTSSNNLLINIPYSYVELKHKIEMALDSIKKNLKLIKLQEKVFLNCNLKTLIILQDGKIHFIDLTEKEVELLEFINSRSNKIASKADLQQFVFKYNHEINSHTVETHIYRIRKKTDKIIKLIKSHGTNSYQL